MLKRCRAACDVTAHTRFCTGGLIPDHNVTAWGAGAAKVGHSPASPVPLTPVLSCPLLSPSSTTPPPGPAFDDLSQAHGEYSKGGYGGSAQSQAKSAGSGPGKGTPAFDHSSLSGATVWLCFQSQLLSLSFGLSAPGLSGSGNSGGVPDLGGSIYNKTQVSAPVFFKPAFSILDFLAVQIKFVGVLLGNTVVYFPSS